MRLLHLFTFDIQVVFMLRIDELERRLEVSGLLHDLSLHPVFKTQNDRRTCFSTVSDP